MLAVKHLSVVSLWRSLSARKLFIAVQDTASMNPRRRKVLTSLGTVGISGLGGCLRLSTRESTDTGTRSSSQPESPSVSTATLSVTVVGRQFQWAFSYPELGVTDREELVAPVGHTLELAVTSEDVVHGFAIQPLDVTVDALPDEQTAATVELAEPGEYTAICTELCGEGHAEMTAPVRVVTQAEFDSWRGD